MAVGYKEGSRTPLSKKFFFGNIRLALTLGSFDVTPSSVKSLRYCLLRITQYGIQENTVVSKDKFSISLPSYFRKKFNFSLIFFKEKNWKTEELCGATNTAVLDFW